MIPPEACVKYEAAVGAETAIAVAIAAWCAADQVAKGSPHVDLWTRKGFMDKLELTTKCVIESKHQPILVHQLR